MVLFVCFAVAESVPGGIRVRVGNLPKKKNIHRDLKAAFDGVPGLIHIYPAVSGNKKTKDPVCKGFAFVGFKCEVDATRFVQNFSGHKITFGRIQKQIKCEMVNPSHEELNSSLESLSDEVNDQDDELVSDEFDDPDDELVPDEFDDQDDVLVSDEFDDQDDVLVSDGFDDQDVVLVSDEFDDQDDVLVSDEFDDQDDEFDGVELGEARNNINATIVAEAKDADIMEPTFKREADSSRLERIRDLEKRLLARGKQQRVPKEQKGQKLERVGSIKKKVLAKRNQPKVLKEQKVQKLDIPGSAKRLKTKEKAQLTGVFSKYGLKTLLTSNEES
ncbi:ribosomal RNA processing protein 1 homolog [Hibiscus syriacus]|uniref:ribosomal RNA processing protein 1 homolog n=1 Tax=Hibiscus syriacus TaxID=106335 RepID=UPI001922E5C8|nr:ribosomal RNA processing protein 1 homolog [Hibiscus syriacus]